MLKVIVLSIALLFVFGCTTAQPQPTLTKLLPTDTSVPPTPTPMHPAELVLLAYAEAITNHEYEKAKSYLSEDFSGLNPLGVIDGDDAIDEWVDFSEELDDSYEFGDFRINEGEVSFRWLIDNRYAKMMCKGYSRIEEEKIVYLEMTACEDVVE